MGILDHDVVVMDQVRSFLSNDFAVHDAHGGVIGRLHTEGGAGSRMLMGTRDLALVDTDGTLLVKVHDIPNLGLDRFELRDPYGALVGQVVKEFTFFSKSLRVELGVGAVLTLSGSLFDHEFTALGPGGQAARVSRHWPGVAQALLGRERYVVAMTPGVPPIERVGVLGAVIALDLVRAKDRRSG